MLQLSDFDLEQVAVGSLGFRGTSVRDLGFPLNLVIAGHACEFYDAAGRPKQQCDFKV